MIRSGSTLQYQIAKELLLRAGLDLRDLGFYRSESGAEVDLHRLSASACKTGQWMVLKCHQFDPTLAELISQGKAKGLYTYRDLRDVYCSHLRVSGQREIFVDVLIWRKQCRTSRNWMGTPGILVQRYEDFVDDVRGLVARTAAYLGLSLDPSEAEDIASQFSLQRQEQRVRSLEHNPSLVPSEYGPYDPESQLHRYHIATPSGGAWRQLPSFKIAAIEAVSARYCRSNGYQVTQSLLMRVLAVCSFGPASVVRALKWEFEARVLKRVV